VESKLGRATLPGTVSDAHTITINIAGLLRITATTSGVGDGTGGLMTIVAGGETYTGNSGGTGGSWSVNITKTVTANQTITFAAEYHDGSFNNLQVWVIPAAAPPTPTSLASPSQGSGSAYLTWAAPANDGGSAITDYVVQYSSNSGSTWTTVSRSASTALSATINGLTNGTSYQFRVAGVNGVGTGSYSSTTTATPTAGNSFLGATSGSGTVSDPYILNNVTVSATASVTIQWQQVATGRYNCDYGDHVTLERRNSSNALISANDRRDGAAQISNPVTLNTGDKLVTYNDCADGYYRVWFV
jgi:hypothetical protein